MKKVLLFAIMLPFAACKKNTPKATPTTPPPPDITESLSLSIINQNPDKYDSARGHVVDSFSWSIPNAYGDTCVISNGKFILPSNATTLILENLIYNYGTAGAVGGHTFVSVNGGSTLFNTIGLTIGLPADTSYISIGSSIAGFYGGSTTFADTVAGNRTYGTGLTRMINWWRGDAIPVNDSITNYVNINTNPLWIDAEDTIMLTSKNYIGDELVVSGAFSEKLYTGLSFPYAGSYCRKTWYVKGTFSNMNYVFKPD
jgi:hypothetical protein